ncbi:ATP-binding protein, partial [Vibrio parahaemolyticus]|nr:ATP-binding protein [Vibrio parahaemolyticus]
MVINEQKLTLVRGIPGSGKSTHAKTLDAKLVEADQ